MKPGAKVISRWTPAPGVTVVRPAMVPAGAALHAPYQDGLWLQGSADTTMRGLGVEPAELAPAWGNPRTVNEFTAALRRAG